MGRGRLIGPAAEKITLDDLGQLLLGDYRVNGRKSLKRAELSVNTLKAHLGGDTRALDLTSARVNRYTMARLEVDRVKPATVQKELAAPKRAFNLAVQADLLNHVPHIPSIRVRNTRTGFFEQADFDAVLNELPDYVRAPMDSGISPAGARARRCCPFCGFGSILAALDRYYAPLDVISIALALYHAFRLSASKPPAESRRNSRSMPRRPAI